VGDRMTKIFSVVGAAAYTSGGDALTPTQLGFVLGDPEFEVAIDDALTGVSASYDYSGQKLKCFSGASEATGNLSTSTFRIIATGKYPL
jgi:hypothetical protein